MAGTQRARTIAITSGKGGIGKSNVALNTAILLSAAGQRVALVDADLGTANLDVLMNLSVGGNLTHVMAGRRSLDQVVMTLPCGVQFVPGASGLAAAAHLSELQRLQLIETLTALEAENDLIIVDTGAGIGPDVLGFCSAADNVIVVTGPEATAMTDCYAVIKVLAQREFDGHLSVLVNMASGRMEARATYQRVSSVARQFLDIQVYDAGYILEDNKLRDSVRRREPVVLAWPRCPASRCLAALATKLCEGGALVERRQGFFRRVANWFA
jgi:flagellar biosynthesis protein FlhG